MQSGARKHPGANRAVVAGLPLPFARSTQVPRGPVQRFVAMTKTAPASRSAQVCSRAAVTACMLMIAGCSVFRSDRPATASATPADSKAEATMEKAAEIATQPARDLGAAKTEIPDVLVQAAVNPYDRRSTQSCKAIAAEIASLNEHLGPDYLLTAVKDENKAGKLAEAGGRTIINTIIPFRGLVREMTGAAEAQRRFEDAVDAGYSRRGFLRGIQLTRKCRRMP